MSVHQGIKKRFVSAIEELSWVTEGGGMYDLRDACYVAREVLAAGLDHIKRMEGTNKGTCAMYDAMIVDQADKIKRLEAEMPRWISVEHEPPTNVYLQAYVANFGYVEKAKYEGRVWRTSAGEALNLDWVTHWMQLPEPPKEE